MGGIHGDYVRDNSHVGTPVAPAAPAAPPQPSTAPRRGNILIHSYLSSWQGYGQHGEWMGRGLESLGHRVDYSPINIETQYIGLPPWVEARIVAPQDADWSIVLAVPEHPTPPGRVVRFTMWETSRISRRAVAELNKAALVVVPCSHNVAAFRDSGVTVPIEVVTLGIDPVVYFDDGTPPPDRTVFGMAARMAHGGVRKGINEGMAAFVNAFPDGEDVELQVKVFPDCLPTLSVPDDPRIKVITAPMTPAEMAAWYRGISCLFVPSKGEGWGFHTQQAMACARPAIAAPWSGTAEFFDGTCGWSLDYDLAPAGEFYAMDGAEWAVPRHDSMVSTLRHVHANRDEVIARGTAAAIRGAEFPWSRMACELDAALRAHGFLPAPTPGLAASIAAHKAVAACPHRTPPACGCPGEPSTCARPDRAGEKLLAECLECVGHSNPI